MSEAAALGYSIVANLGGERQMTVQCFVGHDEDLAGINTKIDKAQAVLDRQRAKYQIGDLIDEREKQAVTLGRAEDDLARIESQHQVDQAALDTRAGLLAGEIKGIDELAHARGRSAPVGGEAQRRRNLQAELEDLAKAKAQAQAERDQHRQNVLISIGRFREAVEDLTKKIAAAQALIDGG